MGPRRFRFSPFQLMGVLVLGWRGCWDWRWCWVPGWFWGRAGVGLGVGIGVVGGAGDGVGERYWRLGRASPPLSYL